MLSRSLPRVALWATRRPCGGLASLPAAGHLLGVHASPRRVPSPTNLDLVRAAVPGARSCPALAGQRPAAASCRC